MSGAHLASESAHILKSSHNIGDNDSHVTIFEDSSHLQMTTNMTQNKNLSPAVKSLGAPVVAPCRAGPSMLVLTQLSWTNPATEGALE